MKIYLIWGPPKCGKTTLSKELAKKLGISYVSADTLESILHYYLPTTEFSKSTLKWDNKKSNDTFYSENTTNEIMNSYISQWRVSYKAIRSVVETSIIEEDSIIIEWYQVTPEVVSEIKKEFGNDNIREVFLIKTDINKFLENIHNSTTPNDWILKKTKLESTFLKITEMLIGYSKYFVVEAGKYNLKTLNMDDNFLWKIEEYTQRELN